MLNYWHGVGNLTRDPESKTRSDGVLTCRFTVAVNRRKNKETGQTTADFIPVRCSRGLAENCMKYLKKGNKISVTGPIHTYNYDDQQGQKHFVVEVEATDIDFLPSGTAQQSGDAMEQNNYTSAQIPPQFSGATNDQGFTQVSDDDLPF